MGDKGTFARAFVSRPPPEGVGFLQERTLVDVEPGDGLTPSPLGALLQQIQDLQSQITMMRQLDVGMPSLAQRGFDDLELDLVIQDIQEVVINLVEEFRWELKEPYHSLLIKPLWRAIDRLIGMKGT